MSLALKTFIANYATFRPDELEQIVSSFKHKKFKKNEFVLTKGSVCQDLVFVEKGCLRLYYIQDDIETSVWFAMQNSSAIEMHSFISETPTNYYIQAIEDSEIAYLPKIELTILYQKYPVLQEMMRKFWEDVIINLLERFTALQRDSAEKRYLDLLNKPDYLQNIPQKYLASFIGVTPTSLSRIKKQIMLQGQ